MISSGSYEVELAVSSADVAKVAVGQSATLTVSTSSSSSTSAGGFRGFPGGVFPGADPTTGNATTGTAATGSARSSATGAAGATATGSVTEVGAVADASSGVATFPVTVTFTGAGRPVLRGGDGHRQDRDQRDR